MRTYVRMSQGTILHADLDAFYASVEQRDEPRLRGRPVIVGGGVVLAASYEAKARGVRTAMGGRQARRLCPQAIVVPPRMSAYSEASKAVFGVFDDTTPLVEGLSIDEAFLDVRGLRRIAGTPTEIAVRLRREVRERVGLPITVGVARTKFLAKVASARRQARRAARRAARRRAGLPPSAAGRAALGRRAGHRREAPRARDHVRSARWPSSPSRRWSRCSASRPAGTLHALAHNRDPRPVQVGRRRRLDRIAARARAGRRKTHDGVDASLVGLVDRVTRRHARGRPGRPHGRAAAALRRLLARDALAHAAPRHRAHADGPRHGAEALLATAMPTDRAPGPHPRRRRGRQPRRRRRGPARRCRSIATAAAPSTPRSTRSATASARRRSPAPCCSAATRA